MNARASLASLFSLLLLPAFAIGCASDAEPDVCEEAIALVDSCTGTRAAYPAEGCVGVYEEQASAIVAGGCEGLLDDKADAWCHPALHWLGQCDQEPLQEVAALSGLNEVCPNAREDVLCESMRVAEDLALDAIIGGDRSAANDAYSEVLVVACNRTRVKIGENIVNEQAKSAFAKQVSKGGVASRFVGIAFHRSSSDYENF